MWANWLLELLGVVFWTPYYCLCTLHPWQRLSGNSLVFHTDDTQRFVNLSHKNIGLALNKSGVLLDKNMILTYKTSAKDVLSNCAISGRLDDIYLMSVPF